MGNIENEVEYYNVKEYWEWRAREYGSSYKGWKAVFAHGGDKHYFEYRHMLDKKAILNFIQILPGMKILDVGCGVGRWCVEFARRGANVTGIDISEEMIRITSENMKGEGLNGHLVVESTDEIDFPDNTFDLVTSLSVLVSVTEPEKFQKSCRNIVRVTRPGGEILLKEWAPKKRRKFSKYIIGRALHEYREAFEREGAFLIKERGMHLLRPLDEVYDTIADKLGSILKKRSKCVDEPLESGEFIETTHPKLLRLFHLGKRAIIALSKPVELYIVPLRPFNGLPDTKLMLFQKKSL